jgi:hypothetical protein
MIHKNAKVKNVTTREILHYGRKLIVTLTNYDDPIVSNDIHDFHAQVLITTEAGHKWGQGFFVDPIEDIQQGLNDIINNIEVYKTHEPN